MFSQSFFLLLCILGLSPFTKKARRNRAASGRIPRKVTELLRMRSDDLAEPRGTVDLIVGGPPWQGFSTVGRRREGDERNSLVHSHLKLVKLVHPRAILFENVRGFTMKFKAYAKANAACSQLVQDELPKLWYHSCSGTIEAVSFARTWIVRNHDFRLSLN
jgi:hypothetical protein